MRKTVHMKISKPDNQKEGKRSNLTILPETLNKIIFLRNIQKGIVYENSTNNSLSTIVDFLVNVFI